MGIGAPSGQGGRRRPPGPSGSVPVRYAVHGSCLLEVDAQVGPIELQPSGPCAEVPFHPAFGIKREDAHLLQQIPLLASNVDPVSGNVPDESVLDQKQLRDPGIEIPDQVLVAGAALGAQLEVDPGAEQAETQADGDRRSGQGSHPDALGAQRGQLLVGAEAPVEEQHGGEQSDRKGEGQDVGQEQPKGLEDHRQGRLAAAQEGDDLLEHVAEDQHEDEDRHRHRQDGKDLLGDVAVDGSHRILPARGTSLPPRCAGTGLPGLPRRRN